MVVPGRPRIAPGRRPSEVDNEPTAEPPQPLVRIVHRQVRLEPSPSAALDCLRGGLETLFGIDFTYTAPPVAYN